MDIYFDFEATQFSQRVLAIGASCEYGDFDCLVKPRKKDKITNFITKLTGIDKEMVSGAPNAEEAFSDLYNWLSEMTIEADTPIFYHCYGDSDPVFLMNTADKMDESPVRDFVVNLAESLLDDSKIVKKFFHSKEIGLYKALKYFEPELPDQTHDPLDDAIMLHDLMKHLETAGALVDCPFEECVIPVRPKKVKKTKTKNSYYIEAVSVQDPNSKPKKFANYRAAFDFCISKVRKYHPEAKADRIERRCLKAVDTGSTYLNRTWKKIMI